MSVFDYLSVLFSVVLGLALTQVLQGFRSLLLARKRVIFFWPAAIWPVLAAFIVIQVWWSMFGMAEIRHWTFGMYATVMLQITIIYLAAGQVIPDIPAEGPVDMRANYYEHAQLFFALLAATILSTLLKDFVTLGHIITGTNALYLGSYFALSLGAAFVRANWYHLALAPLSVVILALNTFLT